MSNHKKPTLETESGRVIKVRPLNEFIKHNDGNGQSVEHIEQMTMQMKIEEAKQELYSIEQQRSTLLENLHREIEQEKKAWEHVKQEEMERVRKEAYEAGFSEGKTESIREYKHLINQANELVDKATEQYYEKIKQHEPVIAQLAVQIAEKILKDTLNEDPSAFLSIVQAAIQDLKDNSTFSIFLHPKNYQSVVKQKDELSQSVDETATISLYINEELDVNSCLIEHSAGKIDASVDTQLKEIKSVLADLTEPKQ